MRDHCEPTACPWQHASQTRLYDTYHTPCDLYHRIIVTAIGTRRPFPNWYRGESPLYPVKPNFGVRTFRQPEYSCPPAIRRRISVQPAGAVLYGANLRYCVVWLPSAAESMSRDLTKTAILFFWAGATALALGVFLDITKDLLEGEVNTLDQSILLTIAKARTPWLTVAAVDLTALGSITLVALFSALAAVTLLAWRNRMGALQVAAALGGAALWTLAAKDLIDRPRPEVVPRLIEVTGYSYPSGHSLIAASVYFTIALLALPRLQTNLARGLLLAAAALFVLLVAFSRVYLGVHYPTDVASGVALGAAWAFFLAGCFSYLRRRAPDRDRKPRP